MNKLTRQLVKNAKELIGTKYVHQGRSAETGVDCVGFFVVLARKIGYPVEDNPVYHRIPDAKLLLRMLRENLDEVPNDEMQVGDILLVRNGRGDYVHCAILISDETDIKKGIVPQIVHANGSHNIKRVIKQNLNKFKPIDIKKVFRLKELE